MGRPQLHRHVLYEAAVQSPDCDLDFFERIYRRHRGRRFRLLREDFCGTAALACRWVQRGRDHEAWALDRHRPTLEWGRRHRRVHLGRAARRVHLRCADVLRYRGPRVDVIAALNFSYSVFKERRTLLRYLLRAREGLRRGGILFLDAWGGTETMAEARDRKRIAASRDWDQKRIPSFVYEWEQARFNPITHEMVCYIHFELPDGTRMERAFRYDWRLWTLPELRELCREAGFRRTEVYAEGWDEETGEGNGIYRRRVRFENSESWVVYLVALL